MQALRGEPLTVYGDGSQTRSLCFVDDEIGGLLALLDSSLAGPVNIGNPDERTMLDLAHFVLEVDGLDVGHRLRAAARPTTRPAAAPTSRWPGRELGWEPTIGLREGIERTIEYFADKVKGRPDDRRDET